MKQKDLERYRQRLQELGKDIESKQSKLSNEALREVSDEKRGNVSKTPVHLGDAGSEHYQQEVAAHLLQTEREIAREIADAFNRIDQGTFGQCQDCGKQISENRLEALPYARFCINCSRHHESISANR